MPQTYLYLTLSGYETTSHFLNIVNTSTVVLYMGMKLYPTYYIVIVCVKIIKLPSMLSTECGLCGVLWAQVAEPQDVLSHLPLVHSHPEGSGGFWALEWEIWFFSSLPGALPDPVLNPGWLRSRCQVTEMASSPFLLPTSVCQVQYRR